MQCILSHIFLQLPSQWIQKLNKLKGTFKKGSLRFLEKKWMLLKFAEEMGLDKVYRLRIAVTIEHSKEGVFLVEVGWVLNRSTTTLSRLSLRLPWAENAVISGDTWTRSRGGMILFDGKVGKTLSLD